MMTIIKLVLTNLAPYSSLGQSSPYDDEDGGDGDDGCAYDGGHHDDDDYKACFGQLGPILLSWPELS